MQSAVLLCFALFGLSNGAFKLEERYSWNQMDFVFPTRAMKGLFKKKNLVKLLILIRVLKK